MPRRTLFLAAEPTKDDRQYVMQVHTNNQRVKITAELFKTPCKSETASVLQAASWQDCDFWGPYSIHSSSYFLSVIYIILAL